MGQGGLIDAYLDPDSRLQLLQITMKRETVREALWWLSGTTEPRHGPTCLNSCPCLDADFPDLSETHVENVDRIDKKKDGL